MAFRKVKEKIKSFLSFDSRKDWAQEPDAKEKWRLILRVLIINFLFVPVLAVISYVILGQKISPAASYPIFFLPLSQFYEFFIGGALQPALMEETLYRSWIWIFTLSIYKARFIRNENWKIILAWLVIVGPTVIWARSHTWFVPPVFFAGMMWGYLIVKTKSFWPAIFSHCLSNTVIYLIIKIVTLFLPNLIKNL